jgi:hypothetical protein
LDARGDARGTREGTRDAQARGDARGDAPPDGVLWSAPALPTQRRRRADTPTRWATAANVCRPVDSLVRAGWRRAGPNRTDTCRTELLPLVPCAAHVCDYTRQDRAAGIAKTGASISTAGSRALDPRESTTAVRQGVTSCDCVKK